MTSTVIDNSGPDPIDSTRHAYEHVRRAIMDAELRPGQIVSQVRLAADLNISRTPLREALRRLQTEGLLEGDFNRRLRVAALTVLDLEQLAAMRISLETLGVRASVPLLAASDIEVMDDALRQMDAALAADAYSDDGFRVSHRVFHTTLFGKAGPRLRTQLEELWDHAERYRVSYRKTATDQRAFAHITHIAHDEHAAILDAARRRDVQKSGELIAEHLARTALTTIAKLDPGHDPHLVREALSLASSSGKP
ncbi:GntR family transcriptional regulator [Nocardia sp. NPDC052278]|uniref:GntR family transcriptional regulator n=1 Tax=unclassified Nocardia TaxID=2637762 RepID=UPI0036C1CE9F